MIGDKRIGLPEAIIQSGGGGCMKTYAELRSRRNKGLTRILKIGKLKNLETRDIERARLLKRLFESNREGQAWQKM